MNARSFVLIAVVCVAGGLTMGFPFAAGIIVATLWDLTVNP